MGADPCVDNDPDGRWMSTISPTTVHWFHNPGQEDVDGDGVGDV